MYRFEWYICEQDALQRNPKSYSAWFQRQWVIDRGLGDLPKEIALCDKLLELDERNFHCWNYRRHVCHLAGVSREDELAFSTRKIEQNFSNYSVRSSESESGSGSGSEFEFDKQSHQSR